MSASFDGYVLFSKIVANVHIHTYMFIIKRQTMRFWIASESTQLLQLRLLLEQSLTSVSTFKDFKDHDWRHTTLSVDSEILSALEKNNSNNISLVCSHKKILICRIIEFH